jgi:hypothetical protein
MLARTVRAIAVAVLFAYSARLVWGRGALFWRAWHEASRNYKRASHQHTDCIRNHGMIHTWANECDAAERTIQEGWPVTRALTTLMDSTYLCIEVPCAVLVAPLVATTSALVAWCVVLVISACALRIAWNAKPIRARGGPKKKRDISAFVLPKLQQQFLRQGLPIPVQITEVPRDDTASGGWLSSLSPRQRRLAHEPVV